MHITAIETYPLLRRVRPDLAITSAAGSHHESHYLLVAVRTDAGLTGWGEFSGTPVWSGETLEGAQVLIENYFAPRLLGREVADVPNAARLMQQTAVGNPFAKAAVEMALYDAKAQAAGLPLHALLYSGVTPQPIPIRGSIGAVEPAGAQARAAWFLERGLRAVKVKVGTEPEKDVERVRAVRREIGPDVRLGIDANGGWNVDDATACVEALEDCDLQYVEQPVTRSDFAGMRAVKDRVHIPVMADETVWTWEDVGTLLYLDAADIVSVYPGKIGGLIPCYYLARRLAEAGKTVYIGSNLEMDVGSAAMAHLAVGLPGTDFAFWHCDIIGPLYYDAPITTPPFRIENGCAHVPEGPGLGVTPLPEVLT